MIRGVPKTPMAKSRCVVSPTLLSPIIFSRDLPRLDERNPYRFALKKRPTPLFSHTILRVIREEDSVVLGLPLDVDRPVANAIIKADP